MIINYDNSKEGDRARAAIIKIYSMETNLYSSINTASQFRDKSKIQTLGPYVYLLYLSLEYMKDSKLNQNLKNIPAVKYPILLKGTGWENKNLMKLYRGLSLPPKAVDYYKQKQINKGSFLFNGFTSTTLDKKVAIGFAKGNAKKGTIPVIFEIYLYNGNFYDKQYLDSNELSAFPSEKEILVGDKTFFVVPGESNFKKDENGILII